MLSEPKLIKLLSHGDYCCEITKDEIMTNYMMSDEEVLKMNLKTACLYFSKFTDDGGVCTVEMQDLFDGNTFDQIRKTAVDLILTTLHHLNRLDNLPDYVILQGIKYVQNNIFELEMAINREKKMIMLYKFNIKSLKELLADISDNESYDDVFDRIFSYMPSIKYYYGVKDEEKTDLLTNFHRLLVKTKYCSTTYYADVIQQYIDVLNE